MDYGILGFLLEFILHVNFYLKLELGSLCLQTWFLFRFIALLLTNESI